MGRTIIAAGAAVFAAPAMAQHPAAEYRAPDHGTQLRSVADLAAV